jgi:putative ABC transport system permease protein
MEWPNILRARLRALFRRESVMRDIEEELRIHVEIETETNINRGMPPDEARAAALKSFGNLVRNTERGYDIRGGGWLETLWQDLCYGMRILLKNPAFTLAAIISLAIGIGANTALFSVANAVLWRPMPYPHSERLVFIEWYEDLDGNTLSEAKSIFDGLAPWNYRNFTLTGHGPALQFWALCVSPELLPLLGFTPQLGRTFATEEFQPGHDQVAIISDRLWRNCFSADSRIIGQTMPLNDLSYTIVGVAPPGFDFFSSDELLIPLVLNANDLDHYCCLESVARLKPGKTLEQSQRELAVIANRSRHKRELHVKPLHESVVKDFRFTLLAFWGVAGFVWLIACANLANLMLARAANRQKELAVRAAIGARRLRLIRQLLTESVLVALLGGALGLLFAYFGVKALSAANPEIHQMNLGPKKIYDPSAGFSIGTKTFIDPTAEISRIPRLVEVGIDNTEMFFTLALALLTGTLFGLAPALQISQPDLTQALKDGAVISGAGFGFTRRRRTQNLLVIGEVALSLLLLIGAGLLIRSIWRLQEEKLGFQPEKLLTMQLEFPSYKYHDRAMGTSFITQLSEHLAALPGVVDVGAADTLPLLRRGGITTFIIDGKDDLTDSTEVKSKVRLPNAFFCEVSSNYIHALGIPLQQGRGFDAHDNLQSSPVAIINESMARRYWPGENPIGKRFKTFNEWRTVVGVVGDVKRFALEYQTIPEFYLPLLQTKGTDFGLLRFGTFVVMRVKGRPADLKDGVEQTVRNLDPDLPIQRVVTMEDQVADVFAPRRFNMLLFGVFAFVALLLAVIGIYSMIAYSVARSTHEIGIRMALGATSRDVLWLVVRQGLLLTLIGVALGIGAALALTRILKNLLFEVSATDPATFVGITLLLISVAFIASYIPARRATKVDPMVALRHD